MRWSRRPPPWRVALLLALASVLAQSVLFELAMAARERAVAFAPVPPVHAAHVHEGHGAAPTGGPAVPKPHEHGGKDCPFCIARAMHQAPGLPLAGAILVRQAAVALLPLPPPARPRAWRRPVRHHARAPPLPNVTTA